MPSGLKPASTSSSALQGLPTPPLIHDNDPRSPRIPNGSQVLVTLDIDAAYFVDLSSASSPAAIKEKIYAKLGIYDDEHSNCRISRCRAGQPVGQPLDDWQLWDMCMRSSQEVDPPMLIVHSATSISQPTPSSSTSSISMNNHQATTVLSQMRSALSPHSPDSASNHKFDNHSSSAGGRDSPDLNLRSSRSRWQHQKSGQDPNSPRSLNQQSVSSAELRSLALNSVNPISGAHPVLSSPISSPFADDRRMSPTATTPIENSAYIQTRRSAHPHVDQTRDWSRSPSTPNHTLDQSLNPSRNRRRRPSEPYAPLISPSNPSGNSADRQNRPQTSTSGLSNNYSNQSSSSRAISGLPASSSSSLSSRRDLATAKSMDDLRPFHQRDAPKWAIPGITHPPLPKGAPTSKIPLSPRARNPAPLRIPRSEGPGPRTAQQPPASNRPSYIPSTTPNFPFPQPHVGLPQRNQRFPVYSTSQPRPGSSGGPVRVDVRVDPRTGALSRPSIPNSGASQLRNPRGSLQIENRLLDSPRPPPRPWTGDATSSNKPGAMSSSTAAQSQIQQSVNSSSLQLRPGEIFQESVNSARRRDRSRDYPRDLNRESATSSSSMRSTHAEDQIELLSNSSAVLSQDRPALRQVPDGQPNPVSRHRAFNGKSGSQSSSVRSSDNSLSPSRVVSNPDAYGGFATEDYQELESNGSFSVEGQLPKQAGAKLSHGEFSERDAKNFQSHSQEEMAGWNRQPQELVSYLSHMSLQSENVSSSSTGDHTSGSGSSLTRRARSPSTLSTSATTWANSTSSSNPTTAASSNAEFSKKFGYLDDDDDDEEVGTFLRPMQPYSDYSSNMDQKDLTPPVGSIKPKLTLQTDSHNVVLPLIDNERFRVSAGEDDNTESAASTLKSTAVANKQPDEKLSAISAANQRASRRISFTGDDWANRPAVDDVYENLEEFFPHHDLDKPIDIGPAPVEIGSPTSPQALQGGLLSSSSGPLNPTGLSTASQARLKGRTRSIRVVAQEKKRLLRRTEDKVRASYQIPSSSGADRLLSASGVTSVPAHSSMGSALLRRKSTKLWGARIEEVTPGDQVSIPSSILESPKDGSPNFSFKWVKGELIGKGSFGQVYLALNATNGEMLAVKQVELPKTRSDRDCDRQKSVVAALKSEIHLMRDLEHPNIVQYLGFEETTDFLSIFLEYVPGGSIGRCLRRHGAFDLNVIKSFTSQTLEGLKYLHSLHILHRDLKADNLLVDLHGNCKISDFGISKKSEHVYEDNTQMSLQGSIFWMAPEVVHNPGKKGYSAKVDIWSLGCVVLEMFAGRRPWSDDEAIQAMFKLGAERLRPPVPADVKLGRMSDHFLAQCFIV
ncbi:STE/STE11 protein kinase [Phakopsora pachyrhizi]|nr:STE/STE11 protein kinase [Phakopsora pachyrhizi]